MLWITTLIFKTPSIGFILDLKVSESDLAVHMSIKQLTVRQESAPVHLLIYLSW